MEERRGVAAHERAREAERLAAGVGEHAGGDALGGAAALVLVDLVTDQQVEEALQAVLHVVGERVALGTGAVGLPERGAALRAPALAAREVTAEQGHAVLVHDLRVAVGAARHPEGLARLLVVDEPPGGRRPALHDGRLPAIRELGALPRHDHEERAGPRGRAQPLQVGDRGDDDGAGTGHRLLDLALPLAREVRRAEHEHPLEAGHVGRRGGDEGLARAHLPDDGGAALRLERERRAADGVGLRAQRSAQQGRERPVLLGGPVAGWVGLHHPSGDGVAVGVDESCEVHGSVPFLLWSLTWRGPAIA